MFKISNKHKKINLIKKTTFIHISIIKKLNFEIIKKLN